MSELLEICYQAIDKKLGDDITILDFHNHSPYIDYFLIATAANYRMACSIIDEVEAAALKAGYQIKRVNKGDDTSKWLLIDLNDIVCHIFVSKQERQKYDLEGLWADLTVEK